MMINYLMISGVMFLSGLLFFTLKSNYLLLMLLSLEFLVLSLYYSMSMMFMMNMSNYFFMLVFLTLSVCEGVLGLAMLVLMIRNYGNDFMSSSVLLW